MRGFLGSPKPTAWPRTTRLRALYIRKLSTLNMKIEFRTSQSMAEETALLDSGATENCLDIETWKRLGIGKTELHQPIPVYNIDGTENKQCNLTHNFCLRIR